MIEPIIRQRHPCGCERGGPDADTLCPTALFLRLGIVTAQNTNTPTRPAWVAYEAHYPRGFTPDVTHLVCPDCNRPFPREERRNVIRYNPAIDRDYFYSLCPTCPNQTDDVSTRPTINPASKDPNPTQP